MTIIEMINLAFDKSFVYKILYAVGIGIVNGVCIFYETGHKFLSSTIGMVVGLILIINTIFIQHLKDFHFNKER